MRRIVVETKWLIPTDCPRSLMGILKFVPTFCARGEIPPIIIVSASRTSSNAKHPDYFICSGNHRAAAAYICNVPLTADVVEVVADLARIREGQVAKCQSVEELIASCHESADSGGYLKGRWREYLRMIIESGAVGFECSNHLSVTEAILQRGGRVLP